LNEYLEMFPARIDELLARIGFPEGGESNGVARLTFSRLDFESPTRVEQEGRECGFNGWERNPGTLGLAAGYL
jgi:hypothetical protein